MKTRAFTLVEVMIGILITAITLGPVYLIYRSGMKSSVSGMISLELQSEGERIITQIHEDLKNSCLPFDGPLKFRFTDLIKVSHQDKSTLAGLGYTFHSFYRGEDGLIDKSNTIGKELRATRKITYSVESSPNPKQFTLIRTEQTKAGGTTKRILSNRVNFFQIEPRKILSKTDTKDQFLWQVSLKLVEVPPKLAKESGNLIQNRGKGILIGDFYDIVSSDFFNATLNFPFVNRNWYSGIDKAD